MKIAICYNIQINSDRYDEYCDYFAKFCKKLADAEILVITGSVVRDKTVSKDIIMATKFLQMLADSIKIVIVSDADDFNIKNIYYLRAGESYLSIKRTESFSFFIGDQEIEKINDFIQLSINCPHDGHGFYIFDDFLRFYELKNDFGYARFVIKNKSINQINIKKPYYWDIITDADDEYFQGELKKLRAKFGDPVRIIVGKNDINQLTDRAELISKYASPENCEKIIELASPTARKIVRLKKLYFKNCYCFEEGKIDFERLEYGISGVIAGNEMGKSAIINIILIALFGNEFYNPLTDIIRAGANEAWIKLYFNDSHIEKRITTKGIHSEGSHELNFNTILNTSILSQSDDFLNSSYKRGVILNSLDLKPDNNEKVKSAIKLKKKLESEAINISDLEIKCAKLTKAVAIEKSDSFDQEIKEISACLANFPEIPDDKSNNYRPVKKLDYLFEAKIFMNSINISNLHAEAEKIKTLYLKKKKLSKLFRRDTQKLEKNKEMLDNYKDDTLERENAYLLIAEELELGDILNAECADLWEKLEKMQNIKNRYDEYLRVNIDKELYWHKWDLEMKLKALTDKKTKIRQLEENNRLLQSYKDQIAAEHERKAKYDSLMAEFGVLMEYSTVMPKVYDHLVNEQLVKLTKIVNSIFIETGNAGSEIKFDSNYKIYYRDNGEFHAATLTSGYRRFIISLALRIGLWQLTQTSVLDALFLDETMVCDEYHLHKTMEFIENLSVLPSMPSIVFIISHIEFVKNRISKCLIIQKGKNGNIVKNFESSTSRMEIKQIENTFYCSICNVTLKAGYKFRHLESKGHKSKIC